LGNGSTRWIDFQQESTIDAKNGCSRGKQQNKHCTNREWCPGSLVDLVLLSRRDGQKHLPDRTTHQAQEGYEIATRRRTIEILTLPLEMVQEVARFAPRVWHQFGTAPERPAYIALTI
jgi:hypothetical protein